METVGVSQFRENLLKFLRQVERGEKLTITSRGRALARVVPMDEDMKSARSSLRKLGDEAHIGDVISSIESGQQMKT